LKVKNDIFTENIFTPFPLKEYPFFYVDAKRLAGGYHSRALQGTPGKEEIW
jgi:hypothetical protein